LTARVRQQLCAASFDVKASWTFNYFFAVHTRNASVRHTDNIQHFEQSRLAAPADLINGWSVLARAHAPLAPLTFSQIWRVFFNNLPTHQQATPIIFAEVEQERW